MLQAATAWFNSSQILQNYSFSSQSSNGVSSTSGTTAIGPIRPFTVGPWKVQEAHHKLTQKKASIWTCDKKSTEMERMGPAGKEMVIDILKAEVSALGKLRHPCVLEMVEPMEETRSELIFATELLMSSLFLAIPTSSNASTTRGTAVELDEIEIQKGILQLAKGLGFLHTSARLVHSNLKVESVVLNSAGDWKICGLGLTIPIMGQDGNPTRWEFPGYDNRLPGYTQRSFDYMAPEYALDEQITPASDFYSLGCVIYAVHAKGEPPFRNRGNLSTMRSNLGRLEGGGGLRGMEGWDQDLQALINALVTPKPFTRLSAQTLPTHSFFSSLAISTLNFLDRSNFASKSREEKVAFMKGLAGVLPKFSEGMKRRKILPSLLEEMKDPLLLSSILPNVFTISATLDPTEFQSLVLPSLKPLFIIKDPPIVMMVLLENLETLQSKTTKQSFRTDVLPLVYNALESEHATVQERALQTVPNLCETIDYAEVQGTLFPRVALVFTGTRLLSVKVSTLNCFLSMVKTLDASSLTQKLVPLLSKIRTKEPAVMMATLQVHEAMGKKVEREAVATLVLPQLWAMCVGPLLSVDQFGRFMQVIKVLGERIEREHSQYLRDAQRTEDRSALQTNGAVPTVSKSLDFESLVGGPSKSPLSGTMSLTPSNGTPAIKPSWEDDVWGSILGGSDSPKPGGSARGSFSQASTPRAQSPTPAPVKPLTLGATRPMTSTLPSVRALGAKPVQASQASPLASRSTSTPLSPPPQPARQPMTTTSSFTSVPTPPSYNFGPSVMKPTNGGGSAFSNASTQPQRPNYNISMSSGAPMSNGASLTTLSPLSSTSSSVMQPMASLSQNFGQFGQQQPPAPPMGPSMGMGLLQPKKPPTPAWNTGNAQKNNAGWSDFDPLL